MVLKLTDTTFEHHGHAAHVRDEQYFRLYVVSKTFEKISKPIDQHRLIYGILEQELRPVEKGGGGVHALEITCKASE
jgi:stress-induced morphogen